jgi:hypothetical protein
MKISGCLPGMNFLFDTERKNVTDFYIALMLIPILNNKVSFPNMDSITWFQLDCLHVWWLKWLKYLVMF